MTKLMAVWKTRARGEGGGLEIEGLAVVFPTGGSWRWEALGQSGWAPNPVHAMQRAQAILYASIPQPHLRARAS